MDQLGEGSRFRLGDFGFCRRMDYFSQPHVTRIGTPNFTAPEILYGHSLDGRLNCDIYSLGVTLFYLSSNGKFPAECTEKGGSLCFPPNISSAFAAVMRKAMEPDPEKRYQNALEMLKDIYTFVTSGGIFSKDYRFMLASRQIKQKILENNWEKAMEISRQGCNEGSRDCARLLAYCTYQVCGNEPEKVKWVRQTLDTLAYEGDPVAHYLRAVIHSDDAQKYSENEQEERCAHEKKLYAREMKAAADAGYAIAQHIYGIQMLEGEISESPRNASQGFCYLMKAAKAGHLSALERVKQMICQHPDLYFSVSPVLKCRLFDKQSKIYEKFDSYKEREREYRIKSL